MYKHVMINIYKITSPTLHAVEMAKSKVQVLRKLIRKQSRINFDAARLAKLQQSLRKLGERSTFHGVDVLLESKPGPARCTVLLIVLAMIVLSVLTVIKLVAGFINMPISTVINYGKANFHFPLVSVCPDSPFSMSKLSEDLIAKEAFLKSADFWISKAIEKNNGTLGGLLPENYWRQRVKRTLRGIFFSNRSKYMYNWNEYLVRCEYDGRKCELDPEPVDMPTALMAPHGEMSPEKPESMPNTTDQPGQSTTGNGNGGLPSIWPGKPPNLDDMSYEISIWPRGKVILVDNPTKYFCFQLRMKNTVVKEPGSTRGLHLILKRPYSTGKTQPALLNVESRAPMTQAYDDRLFIRKPTSQSAQRAAALANSLDGFHVLIHKDSNRPDGGSITASDIYKAGSSRSIYSLGVRFGQEASVSIGQFIHKRLSSIYRGCGNENVTYNYLELSSFLSSGGFARRYYRVGYTQDNCVSRYRQIMMIRECGCLSEDYLVNLELTPELLRLGFCHSPSPEIGTTSKEFMGRVACHDNISSLTKNQVLDANIPESWGVPILIRLTNEIQRHWMCPQFCHEVVTEAEIVQRKNIPVDLAPGFSSLNETIKKSDLVAVSVYANSARIRIISEGEQMNVFNLFASIGGIFSLYVGLSGVTLFEILEALVLVLASMPTLLRIAGRRILACWSNLFDKCSR